MKTLQQRYGQRMTMESVINYHLPIGTKVSVKKVGNKEGELVRFRNGRVSSDSFRALLLMIRNCFSL